MTWGDLHQGVVQLKPSFRLRLRLLGAVGHTAVTKMEKKLHGFGHYSSYIFYPIYSFLFTTMYFRIHANLHFKEEIRNTS